jgi:CBS domain-containing protein
MGSGFVDGGEVEVQVGAGVGQRRESRVSRFLAAAEDGPRIGELPIRPAPVIPAHLSMAAARKIADLKRATLLFVEHEGRLLGLLDERTLVEAPDEAPVARNLTPIAACLHPELPAVRARELFRRTRAAVLAVTAGAFLLGVVSRADVERAAHHLPRPLLTVQARAAA